MHSECSEQAKEHHAAREGRLDEGTIVQAVRKYGVGPDKILDFSSNVNPLGPSSDALRAARKSLERIHRYPDPAMTDLRSTIARYFGIKAGHVIAGNGSNELIRLILRVYKPARALVPAPTFGEYALAAREASVEPVLLPLKERDGFRIDPLEMAFALKNVEIAFLCNPNNPTGLVIHKPEMLEIAKYALENGVRLVIDEAFMDFLESESMIKDAVQTSHIICLRTFSLFFGMPGLRLGYAVAGEETVAALGECRDPWTVNIPGEQAAMAALQDWNYIKKTRALIDEQRNDLIADLRLLPKVELFLSSTNFILLKVASEDAPLLAEKLGFRGILVRDCSGFPGLNSHFLRIAVRSGRENKRLVKALRELIA